MLYYIRRFKFVTLTTDQCWKTYRCNEENSITNLIQIKIRSKKPNLDHHFPIGSYFIGSLDEVIKP